MTLNTQILVILMKETDATSYLNTCARAALHSKSYHVLTPYVIKDSGDRQEAQRKATCAHLREACVCHPPTRGGPTGAVCEGLSHVSGVRVTGD